MNEHDRRLQWLRENQIIGLVIKNDRFNPLYFLQISTQGKVFGAIFVYVSMIFMAFPLTIIVAAFTRQYDSKACEMKKESDDSKDDEPDRTVSDLRNWQLKHKSTFYRIHLRCSNCTCAVNCTYWITELRRGRRYQLELWFVNGYFKFSSFISISL